MADTSTTPLLQIDSTTAIPTTPTTTQAGSNTPIGTSTVYSAPASSPTTTSSAPAVNAAQNLGANVSTAATSQPTLPSTSNPTGNPQTQQPNSYIQFDGSYGPQPDPYGYGTIGYNPASDPRVAAQGDAANATTKAEETQLQQERDQEIANLTQQEQSDEQQLQQTQAQETGSSTRNLIVTGGAGNSTSQAYLNSLEQSHQTAMSNLVAKYNQAIQAAQNAYTDKDFTLAQQMVANAKQIAADAATSNKNFLDYTYQLRTQADTEAKNAFDQQQAATKTQQTFLKDNGLEGTKFYQYPGDPTVYDSATGKQITADQYTQMGGVGQSGNYSDVTVVNPDLTNKSASYVEWQNYKATGGNLNYNDYLTMDANRKKANISLSTSDANSAAGVIANFNSMISPSVTADGKTVNGKQIIVNGQEVVGPDGHIDPQVFLNARSQVPTSQLTKFDAEYGPMLNPKDRANLGVGSYNVYTAGQ